MKSRVVKINEKMEDDISRLYEYYNDLPDKIPVNRNVEGNLHKVKIKTKIHNFIQKNLIKFLA